MPKAIVKVEDKELTPNYFTQTIVKTLEAKTPANKIKRRPDGFNYVEIGYVLSQLDKAFNHLWEFEVLEQQVGDKQCWVKGRLIVHLAPNFSLKKDAYGSSDIQKYGTQHPKAGLVIDIGNSLKSAESDALKKASSMLGIAKDVYYPRESEQPVAVIGTQPAKTSFNINTASIKQVNYINVLCSQKGIDREKYKEKIGVKSMNDLTLQQAQTAIDELLNMPDKLPEGDKF